MNEDTLRSLREGMKNTDCWYGYNNGWHRGYVEEAIDVLQNKETILDDSYEYECYDYLFD